MTEVKYNIGGGKKIIAEYDDDGIMEITRECFEALIENQTPKKPLDFGDEAYLCPCCKRNNFYKGICLYKEKYCDYCGQRLKWGDEE